MDTSSFDISNKYPEVKLSGRMAHFILFYIAWKKMDLSALNGRCLKIPDPESIMRLPKQEKRN